MASRLQSLQNISAIKCAVLLSLVPEIKREVLCIPESEYSASKSKYLYFRKEDWVVIIERKAKESLQYRKLPDNLRVKVISLLPAIAFRTLIWSEYHGGILGLTRYYSLNFLKYSHFTSQGVIDNKKAAEDMLKDVNLNIKQKYKLAGIYCFTNHISSFFNEIFRDNKNFNFGPEDLKWMGKPEIVKHWTSELMGRVNKSNISVSMYLCRLKKSVVSGSIEAVRYLWKNADINTRENALVFGVKEVLIKINETKDWIVFRDRRFEDSKESWVPNCFYVDILCFFLSNMTKTQQQKALEINIKGKGICNIKYNQITVLELFLCWPYQDFFMKTVAVLWDMIPLHTYAILLLKICDKIEPCTRKNLLYGEEKIYDYKKLLVDFWTQSPDYFKRYIFLNNPIIYWNPVEVKTTVGIGLLLKLLSLKNFTHEDEEIIWLILENATDEERKNLTSAKWWRSTCINIIKKEKFEIFDRLLLLLCKSEEELSQFKKNLKLHKAAQEICSCFLKYSKVDAVKSLIQRITLSDSKLWNLKKSIIYSYEGMQHCRKLLLSHRYTDFEEFVKWYFPSSIQVKGYEKELSINISESFPVHQFSESDVRRFVTSCTSSELANMDDITVIKTSVADVFGRAICEDLIAGSSFQVIFEYNYPTVKSEFTGGKWGRVDGFLRWSLSNEMRIHEFKKTFHELAGMDIHFQLIKAKQWKIAKKYFKWLPLTYEETSAFKKRMIFKHKATSEMFHHLVFDQNKDMRNLGTIDLFLRWHLTDKKSIVEFRDYFFNAHKHFEEDEIKKLNRLIENYLDDMEQAEICNTCENAETLFFRHFNTVCEKRKSSDFSPRKRVCLLEEGNGWRRSERLLKKLQKT